MGKFALLIGVSEYPEGLSALPAAVNDVEAMREVLECPEMGGFDEVTALLNPTEGEFRRSIEDLFVSRASEDLVLLYFSGHGITEPGGKFFFSTKRTKKDARGRLSKPTAIPATEIYDYLEECEADRQIVILDCCHSGAFGKLIPRDGGEIDFKQQLGGIGRVVLTASAAIDYSFERADEPLAIYTRYLVEGIKTGAADRDEDGWVSVDELHDFVVEKLSKAAPGMTPQRYVVKEGHKIKLTKAIVSDPTKQYRKFVKQYSANGIIRPSEKSNLRFERDRLKLSPEEAKAIEDDALRPYNEHKNNLKKYERDLLADLEFLYPEPLDDRSKESLNDLQKRLNLALHEVKAIRQRVIAEFAAIHPVVEPIPSTISHIPSDQDLVALWQKILSNIEEIPARAILSTNCHVVELSGQEIKIGISQKSSLAIVKARSAQLGKACAKTLKGGVKMTFVIIEEKGPEGKVSQVKPLPVVPLPKGYRK